ncbi:MAG: 23S rRNA (guanosine(2251)-2'-O)-methyltransferase RlmB [Clostridia bacterium]|nr:23S rRNA (guanosine(2251)-2'-O)-methyltransferase RlmB [Clostridia bacterium]
MRESYRAKQSRKARINKEKQEKNIEKRNNKIYNKNENRDFKKRDSFKNKDNFKTIVNDEKEEKIYEDVVAGRNAVLELLKSDKDINKLYIERGEKHGSISEIYARANEKKVVLVEVPKQKLDMMAESNQGVVAVVPPFNYCDVDDILEVAEERKEDPFIIILDGIEDVHNLGAIIRTAETAGVHGIIIPKRRNVQVNSTVSKTSAGATTYVKVARVNNLNETIKYLKEKGLWIIGTDGEGDTYYYDQDLKGPLAIIIGSEGNGMNRLVKQNTDILIKIPMFGKITSLNASVSAGIVIYEAVKQRKI